MTDPAPAQAFLELKIDFEEGADAAMSGAALTRMAAAYKAHCRQRGIKGASLVIRRIEIASLFALLEAVVDLGKGAKALYDNRVLLEDFVHQLGAVITTIESGHAGIVPSYMRTLVKALIGPMQKSKASHTTIKVMGIEGVSLEINSSDVDLLAKALKIGDGVLNYAKITGPDPLGESLRPVNEQVIRASPFLPVLSSTSIPYFFGHTPLTIHGTLVLALDSWYVRPATLDGTMLPADCSGIGEKLDRKGTYLVSGHLNSSGGIPSGFVMTSVERRLS